MIGPTGLALGPNDTLYVSDATGNRISAIWDATTRDHSAGVGRTVTKDGLLQTPLALATAPNGHLLVVNAKNGQVVEIDPASGDQIKARWIDPNKAQKPPGSGDLFGIAMTPAGDGFYFVEDEVEHACDRAVSCPFHLTRRVPPGADFWPAPADCWLARAWERSPAPRRQRLRPALRLGNRSSACIRAASQRRRRRTAISSHSTSSPRRVDEVTMMLRLWTDAAQRMTAGETARPLGDDLSVEGPDGGSALGLPPSRLTITFGFGPGLFMKNGADRYGLAAKRPDALVDLPKFNGDQLQPARTGGDISVQACADDPLVAFHAVRELDRLSYGAAQIRWAQAGFLPQTPAGETPRNLMGFKDGTINPPLGRRARHARCSARVRRCRVGRRGGSGLDARRQLHGGAADQDFARALGPNRGRLSGAGDRSA